MCNNSEQIIDAKIKNIPFDRFADLDKEVMDGFKEIESFLNESLCGKEGLSSSPITFTTTTDSGCQFIIHFTVNNTVEMIAIIPDFIKGEARELFKDIINDMWIRCGNKYLGAETMLKPH